MKCIQKFQTSEGNEPFNDWISKLDKVSRYKVRAYIERVAYGGSKKNVRTLRKGLFEIKIDYGPGYRVYFGELGDLIILLLFGGEKRTQKRDIKRARKYWRSINV